MRVRDLLVVIVVIAAMAAFTRGKSPVTGSPTSLASSTPFVHPCPYSINGVRLNMTGPEVKAILGEPTSTADRRWNYETDKLHMTMSFMYDHISSVQCSKGAVFARNDKVIPLIGQRDKDAETLFGPPDERTKTSIQYRRDKAALTIHFRNGNVSEMGIFDDRDYLERRPKT